MTDSEFEREMMLEGLAILAELEPVYVEHDDEPCDTMERNGVSWSMFI